MSARVVGARCPWRAGSCIVERMRLAEAYAEFLQGEGFRPVLDEAGDLVFKCEGRYYCVTIDESDPLYFRLVFPDFYLVGSDPELHWARIAAAEVTAEFKVVKVYPQGDAIQAAAELFLAREGEFRLVFERCLHSLQGAARRFGELMERGPRLRLVEET